MLTLNYIYIEIEMFQCTMSRSELKHQGYNIPTSRDSEGAASNRLWIALQKHKKTYKDFTHVQVARRLAALHHACLSGIDLVVEE
jgi:hypothetical protein